jgi:hypothetical protein
MRSQLSNYTEAQRQVLGISFLGVYDKNSNAIAFSGGDQRGTPGNWRLQGSDEVAGDDCVAARYAEQQIVNCNGTVYLVSVVLVFKASDSSLGDASSQGHDSTLLGYLLGGTPLAGPAFIASLLDRQINHPLIWVDRKLIYTNIADAGAIQPVKDDGSTHEYVIGNTAYLGAARSSKIGSRDLVYGVMTPRSAAIRLVGLDRDRGRPGIASCHRDTGGSQPHRQPPVEAVPTATRGSCSNRSWEARPSD